MRGGRLAELRAEAAEQRLAEMQQGLGGPEDMTQHIEVSIVLCPRQCVPASTPWSVTLCCPQLLCASGGPMLVQKQASTWF